MSKYNYIFITSKNNPSFDFLPLNNIKVFYLEAPISIANDINTALTQVNAYHTGLGFECGNIRFGIEFTCNHPLLEAILPQIVNKNGFEELLWTNDCSVRFIELSLNYWTQSNYICTITKDQFLSFRNDIVDNYIPNNLYYVLFNLCEDNSSEYLKNPTLKSSTCDDFVIYAINFFKKSGVNIEYITYPKVASIDIFGNVKKLNYDRNKNTIISFYKNLYNLFDIISQKNMDYKEIISLVTYYLQNLNTIIYYGYDINNKNKMCYYSVEITNSPVIKYEKINVKNSYSYVPFDSLVDNQIAPNIFPNTISNISNTNQSKNKSINILLIIFAIIVIILIIYLFFKKSSNKSYSTSPYNTSNYLSNNNPIIIY